MANYIIDPKKLKPFLPAKTELDFFNGNAYVSLVGFMFANTKMLGVKIPFHVNFEEVNLRFYVRYNDKGTRKRGVVFIKEIVPKPAIAITANVVYNENYAFKPMKNLLTKSEDEMKVAYYWRNRNRWNKIKAITELFTLPLLLGSEEEFIAEHYWGYSGTKGKTVEYEVKHPKWEMYPVKSYEIECDFSRQYGENFSFLQQQQPSSVFMVKGSAISVSKKRNL